MRHLKNISEFVPALERSGVVEFVPSSRHIPEPDKYGLTPLSTPNECFDAFMRFYGGWLKARAVGVAHVKGVEADEVEQRLMYQAWIGATHESYDASLGKTRVGYIYQRCCWYIQNMMNSRDADTLLDDLTSEDSETTPEDWQNGNTMLDYLGGSRGMTNVQATVETRELFEKIVAIAEEMPYDEGQPLLELLDPSPEFLEYVERCLSTQKGGRNYNNAAKFEFCGSKELYSFTRSRAYHLEAAVAYVRKRLADTED